MDYLNGDDHTSPHLYDAKRSGADFDSFTTSASYETLFEWTTKYMGKKYLRFTTAGNDVVFRVLASRDGFNYDYTAVHDTLLRIGATVNLEIDDFWATLKIEARDGVEGAHGVLDVVLTATSQITAGSGGGGSDTGPYVRTDGSTPLTADWNTGSYNINAYQFESSAPFGISPLIVTSGTKVDNLNSDLLDGHHATDFAMAGWDYLRADGTQPLTANWNAGAYQIEATAFESDVATGTAPLTVASTTAVTCSMVIMLASF